MKKSFTFFLLLSLFLFQGCAEDEVATKNNNPLIEKKNGVETIWYAGKKQVRYRREYDNKNQRHGKWMFYSPDGKVMSSSYYDHGKKTGVWLVNHPNGQLNYTGEYKENKPFGVWIFYSNTGSKIKEVTYDEKGKVLKEEKFQKENNEKLRDSVAKTETRASKK
jgi:antitoxin component YwqK of YwqJK toxin-antitoxin module